jgi:hypothetical protein
MVTEVRAGTGARQAQRLDGDDVAELRAMLAATAGKR